MTNESTTIAKPDSTDLPNGASVSPLELPSTNGTVVLQVVPMNTPQKNGMPSNENGPLHRRLSTSDCDDYLSHLRVPTLSSLGNCSSASEESFNARFHSRDRDIVQRQAGAISRLQNELVRLRLELKTKVDEEIHEFTASLFEEANKMIAEANERRTRKERQLNEANIRIDMLMAEVSALKSLLASPHSSPSSHASPSRGRASSILASFRFARGNTPGEASRPKPESSSDTEQNRVAAARRQLDFREVDPQFHAELVHWRQTHPSEPFGADAQATPFMRRLLQEDILPCLDFSNRELAEDVHAAVRKDQLSIQEVHDERLPVMECALSRAPRKCKFRLNLLESDTKALPISQSCRNRIAAVCDFYTYLRYLDTGLVKCGLFDTYWEIVRLRKNMALARLGLGFLPASSQRELGDIETPLPRLVNSATEDTLRAP